MMRKIKKCLSAVCSVVLVLGVGISQAEELDRSSLPIPQTPFDGVIMPHAADSTPASWQRISAPDGAPNLFLFMSDDVGFGMTSAFGGPVPTPHLEKLAGQGQSYNQFHTTGICSPTRAALLTGRNPHNVGTGYLVNTVTNYPGYDGRIPASTATIAQTLRLNGYNTAMFGKHHNIPPGESSPAGPFDYWPTGLGFEYFYGIIAADSDQFSPNFYRGTTLVPAEEAQDRLMDERLADDTINWIHNQKAAAAKKPFFIYYAPGSAHAPHQAPPEYIERFQGEFDQGWDKVREETHRRQLAMGMIPEGTVLTPRPEGLPAWDSLDKQQQIYAARAMEVAAAMLSYQDEQLGRVLDELARMGELERTLVAVVVGDNGASADAGPEGTLNEVGMANALEEDDEWRTANLDLLGGPRTYANYPAAWAWAMNSPLRWAKQYVSMLGGIRNGLVLSWPGRIAQPDTVCAEFGHVIDIVPTFLEAAGVPAPARVYGVQQKPFDGQSLLASLEQCEPDRPRTQYFEMVGKLGLFHNGWFASKDDGRHSWERVNPRDEGESSWELYDLRSDFSQSNNIAEQHPERLEELVALWHSEAERNQVFPLDDRFGSGRLDVDWTAMEDVPRQQYVFWGKDISVPTENEPSFIGRSFTIEAEIELEEANASGVIMALGSWFGGWSLFLEDGKAAFAYARSTRPEQTVRVVSQRRLETGQNIVRLHFQSSGLDRSATFEISMDDQVLAHGDIPKTFRIPAGLGETLDVGRDLGVAVTEYQSPQGRFEGEIHKVTVTLE